MNRTVAGWDDEIIYLAIGNGEKVPWSNDRSCPTCGEKDLPLLSATSGTERVTLHYIKHCDGQWLRGPMSVRP